MALIKCEECGKKVSDKASNCPHCGAPVEVIKCEECGGVFSDNLESCPHCGAPVEFEEVEEEKSNNNSQFKMNESAIWGFVLSIISIFFHPIALFSIFICIDALLQFRNKKNQERGEGLAIAGTFISAIMLLVMGFNLVSYGTI